MATGGSGQPCGRVSAAHWGHSGVGPSLICCRIYNELSATRIKGTHRYTALISRLTAAVGSRTYRRWQTRLRADACRVTLPQSTINTSANASTLCPSGVFSAPAALSAFSRPRVWGLPFGLPLTPERKPLPVMPPSSFASFRCFGLLFTLILTVAFVHSQHEIESRECR